MSATTEPITAESYCQLTSSARRSELVRGEVREAMPPRRGHGVFQVRIALLLSHWCEAGPGGLIGVEDGFMLARDPDHSSRAGRVLSFSREFGGR